jgi:hypothetical protein
VVTALDNAGSSAQNQQRCSDPHAALHKPMSQRQPHNRTSAGATRTAMAHIIATITSFVALGPRMARAWCPRSATRGTSRHDSGNITLASPRGGAAPIDPLSFDDTFMSDGTRRFEHDAAAQRALANTVRFDRIDGTGFDAAFFPGGYGRLWDLASDSKVIHTIENWIRHATPVAMVCHAPAILP